MCNYLQTTFLHLQCRLPEVFSYLMFITTYISFCRGSVVMPFSDIINHLEREIALKFYTTVFSMLRRTFLNKKSKFSNFTTYSVFYKRCSIIFSRNDFQSSLDLYYIYYYRFMECVRVHPSAHPSNSTVCFSDHAAKEALGVAVAAKIRFARDQRQSMAKEKSAIIPFGCSFNGNALNIKASDAVKRAFISCICKNIVKQR